MHITVIINTSICWRSQFKIAAVAAFLFYLILDSEHVRIGISHAVIICLHAVIIDHQHIVCEIGLVLGHGAAGLVVPGPQPGWPSVSRLGLQALGPGGARRRRGPPGGRQSGDRVLRWQRQVGQRPVWSHHGSDSDLIKSMLAECKSGMSPPGSSAFRIDARDPQGAWFPVSTWKL